MLTGTLLSYRLSRWKLVLLYLAVIPLAIFILVELQMRLDDQHDWFLGIALVGVVVGGVEAFRHWSRFVTELHCTEVGIQANTVIGGNLNVSWSQVYKLNRIRDLEFGRHGAEVAGLEIIDERPLYLWMAKEMRRQLVSLLTSRSDAEVTGFD